MQVIEPVVAQKSPAIAQRATIIQPVVRPVFRRHVQMRGRPPQLVAVCVHGPYAAQCSGVGMLRVKGAEQNNQYVRILPSFALQSTRMCICGAPREHTWRNELSRHSAIVSTPCASETTRSFCRVQRQWTLFDCSDESNGYQ